MDICTITPKISLCLSFILILFAFTSSDNSKDKEECAEPLAGLATCLPYVGGTAKAPTPDCCSGLKLVLKTNKKCLCVAIKDRDDPDLGLNINATLALGLPDVCNAPANISQCPALLSLPPNSADAKIFYQLGQNSNNATATRAVAGGPAASATSTLLRGGKGRASPVQSNNGGGDGRKGKGRLGLKIMCGLMVLLLVLIM